MTKEDANYAIDKALATGLLDSNGNLNFHMHEHGKKSSPAF